MKFVHTPYKPNETVAAIATPPGEGGVAIIRISGKDAFQAAKKVFSRDVSSFKSHTAYHGYILDDAGDKVDEALLMLMKGKKSYTGEDTVEIFCHGGSLISKKVLETVLKTGVRQAYPGEFTFKAYINGKLDLSQAEAVQALIHAKNEKMLHSAEKQLEGGLSKKILESQARLTHIAAILEAWVDFPDEGLEFMPMEELIVKLEQEKSVLQKLLDTYHDGKILSEGLKVALVGSPNVGKSSLMNALLERERAIVSDIAGTTRDILEDHLKLNGLNIILTDTAGIRETIETIEKEGIKRSIKALDEADLVLLVLDSSKPLNETDRSLIHKLDGKKSIIVMNKTDIASPPAIDRPHVVPISALSGIGLDDLKKEIDKVIWSGGIPSKEEIVITNMRHKEALLESVEALQKVIEGLKSGISPEFVAFDIKAALTGIGKIVGADITEDVLTSIFKTFCIGK